MEHELKDENKCSTLEPIDILAIGLNPAIWRGTSNKILEIYYEQSWFYAREIITYIR